MAVKQSNGLQARHFGGGAIYEKRIQTIRSSSIYTNFFNMIHVV